MKLLTFLYACFIVTFSYGQTPQKKVRMEGHFKQVSPDKKILEYVIEYDETGKQKRWINYSEEGKIQDFHVNTYNAKGQLVADTLYDAAKKVLEYWLYSYNDKGTMIRQDRTYTDDNRNYVELFRPEYDADGNVVRELQYDKDSVFEWERIYKYKNKMMVFSLSIFQGHKREEYVKEYKDTLKIKETLYSYDEETGVREEFCIWTYTHDAKGLTIQSDAMSVAAYLKNKELDTSKFFYDNDKRLIREERYKNGSLVGVQVIEYKYY